MPDLPQSTRPKSRMYNARGEHSPQHLLSPLHGQRDSKRFSVHGAATSPKSSPPNSPFSRHSQQQHSRILFYHSHDPYYGFTNFSNHPVVYNGKKYPTSEHLFQSFKFQEHRPDLAEHIRTCSERPSVAFSEARRFQPEVRRDWKDVNIAKMDIVLQLKFEQHDDLRAELLGTGHANLFEDSDKDAFWGVGPDWTGRNELGKALERLRTKLRAASRKSIIQPASATSHNVLPLIHIAQCPKALSPIHSPLPRSPSLPTHSPTHARSPIHAKASAESLSTTQASDDGARSPGHLLLPPSTSLTLVKRDMCRHPDCVRPVYYDGRVKSEYCSQQHRQETVASGFVEACIKCLKMPQSESDFFCGRACREEALSKLE